ncbi:MAG: hypothetical protein U1E09_12675 [Methylococcales bacterium]|jgi:hypothetical protein|nr:hypothetical protein [Methylococcales bacterium]
MSKQFIFDDASVIEWIDKETLRYSEKDFSVSIWVDFEPGFFKSGRIIKASSIKNCNNNAEDKLEKITTSKKEEILAKVQNYYHFKNIKCRVETD